MEIIFLIGSIQAIIFLLLLLSKKQKIFSDKILAILFLILAIHLFLRYIYALDILQEYPHLLGIHTGFPLLYGPFLYFYVDSLTNNRQNFYKNYWYHFIPFFIVIIALIPFYLQPAEIKLSIINGLENYPRKYIFIIIMQLISGPVYVVWILVLLKKHKKNIGLYFSSTEKIELRWLKNLTLGLAGIWLVILSVYAIWELLNLQIPFERELIIYTAVTVFVFFIGYKGLLQSPVFLTPFENNMQSDKVLPGNKVKGPDVYPVLKDHNTKTDAAQKRETDSEFQQYIDKLLVFMKEKKPYLEDNLMLSHVAAAIDIPHYKLTKIFNDKLKQNFFNFVNSYRVEEVKEMLLDPKNDHFTILALAYDCGFSSKASFNRIFKQMTNMTPSEYQRSNRAKV